MWRRNVHVAGRDLWLRLENGRLHVIDGWDLVDGVTEISGSGAVVLSRTGIFHVTVTSKTIHQISIDNGLNWAMYANGRLYACRCDETLRLVALESRASWIT